MANRVSRQPNNKDGIIKLTNQQTKRFMIMMKTEKLID